MSDRSSTFLNCFMLAAMLGVAPTASGALTGPVPRNLLPGGLNFTDSHPASPQQLGLSGGKVFTFESFDRDRFSDLLWGVAGVDAVKISLDGAFDSPGESLSFSPGDSNLPGGVAVWAGSTQIFTTAGTKFPQTRFRMTVRDEFGALAPLTFDGRVNVLLLPTAKYSARLEMFASFGGLPLTECNPGSDPSGQFGGFAPVLDVFTCTGTFPGNAGDALTSLETGFFIEVVNVDLADHNETLLDHNAAVLDKLGAMMVGTSIIENDWDRKWESALEGIGSVDNQLDTLEMKTDQLPQEFQNLAQLIDRLPRTELLAYLLGFEIGPPPPGFPPISDFPGISSLYRSLGALETKADALATEVAGVKANLDALLDSAKVDLEIVDHDSSGRFVMLSSENGKPVDAVVTRVVAITRTASQEVEWVAATLEPGLTRLEVVLPRRLRSAKAFLIQVEHAHGANTVHAGSTLTSSRPQ